MIFIKTLYIMSLPKKSNHGWTKIPYGWKSTDNKYNEKKSSLNKIINPKIISNSQAVFVLAGGLNDNGIVHEWVKRRLDIGLEIAKINKKCKIVCVGGGTYHKPPCMNKYGYVIHESTGCCQYLIHNGLNNKRILKEWASYDTIANVFFVLSNFVIPRNWKNIIVVTSEFHMPRTKLLFEWIFSLTNKKINIKCISANDSHINDTIINSRIEREKNSVKNVKRLKERFKDMESFHEWLYTEHKCYNSEEYKFKTINKYTKKSY